MVIHLRLRYIIFIHNNNYCVTKPLKHIFLNHYHVCLLFLLYDLDNRYNIIAGAWYKCLIIFNLNCVIGG